MLLSADRIFITAFFDAVFKITAFFGSQSHELTLVSKVPFFPPITYPITAEYDVMNSLPAASVGISKNCF
jgi:hypothetical protein